MSARRPTNTRECGWHSLPWQMQSNKRPSKISSWLWRPFQSALEAWHWNESCDAFEVGLLFEEHEERITVIVVRHVSSARLACRRCHGIDGSLSAVEYAGPIPEEFAGVAVAVYGTNRPIAVAFNSRQFGRHRPVNFAVVLLEMLGIVGCLIENDEFDHWYLLLVWRSDRLSHNRIAKLRAVVNEEAHVYAPVDHLRLVQHAGADFEYPNVVFG